ncbi:hypothetical protein L917_17245, partial [Phytophthora nicotianae]
SAYSQTTRSSSGHSESTFGHPQSTISGTHSDTQHRQTQAGAPANFTRDIKHMGSSLHL